MTVILNVFDEDSYDPLIQIPLPHSWVEFTNVHGDMIEPQPDIVCLPYIFTGDESEDCVAYFTMNAIDDDKIFVMTQSSTN